MSAAPDPAPAAAAGVGSRPTLLAVTSRGLCPRCGAKTLFAGGSLTGIVDFADRCPACGLDFTSFNVGDGPAAFLTLIVGALVVGLAIALELTLHPPFWVHVILWVPFTIGAVLLGLRAGKAALLAAEYRRNAGQAGLAIPHDERGGDDA